MKSDYIIPGVYLVFSAFVWIGFLAGFEKMGGQALDNLGLVIAVLPLSLIDIAVDSLFIHGDVIMNWSKAFHALGLPAGDLWDNGYYYFPRALLMAYLLHRWTRPTKRRRSSI